MRHRPAGVRPPDAESTALGILYRRWLSRVVEPRFASVFALHTDAIGAGGVRGRLQVLKAEIEASFDDRLGADVEKIGRRVNKKSQRSIEKLIPISLRTAPGVHDALIAGFRQANVDRIRSLAGAELDTMGEVLEESYAGGWRVERLRKEIKGRFDVTKSKADLLARDQVLKLNGQLNRQRQTTAGITRYRWSTSSDERVRPMHDDLDDTIQTWGDPPVTNDDGDRNDPGGDYQCRCVALPILDALIPADDDTG